MPEDGLTEGDAVLVEFDDGERVQGTITRRTKTYATINIEKKFDSTRQPVNATDETRVITLNQVLREISYSSHD